MHTRIYSRARFLVQMCIAARSTRMIMRAHCTVELAGFSLFLAPNEMKLEANEMRSREKENIYY